MEIIKNLKGESWKSEILIILECTVAVLLFTGLLYLLLRGMESPMGGQRAASGVMGLCFCGGIGLVVGLLLCVPVILMLCIRKIPSIGWIICPIVYNAVFLGVLINVPKWDKIVVNVRDGYHDFQRIHEGERREGQYRMAEHYAEVTRPVWEWLANK